MKTAIFVILVMVLLIGSWIGNFVKLLNCDFEADYKCEIIHSIGIIPILSVLTVWVDSDKPKH